MICAVHFIKMNIEVHCYPTLAFAQPETVALGIHLGEATFVALVADLDSNMKIIKC